MEKEVNSRELWIDVMRGLSIIAVVVCHQIEILHSSERIQCVTLYSVTSLIFLMGVTKAKSLSRFLTLRLHTNILEYTIKSICSVSTTYMIATIFYNYYFNGVEVLNFAYNFNSFLCFDAVPTFYFIRYYLLFSLYAPVLFLFVKKLLMINRKAIRSSLIILFIGFIWLVGYYSIDKFDFFGQSYLFVYTLGMFIGINGFPKKLILLTFSDIILLVVGVYGTTNFYLARLTGNFSYGEFIDALAPKLQINPPNISIILYSFGLILLSYLTSEVLGKRIIIRCFLSFIALLGKYSLDIFIWHIFIQKILVQRVLIDNIVVKGIVYYGMMLFLPILGRVIYTRIKNEMYKF